MHTTWQGIVQCRRLAARMWCHQPTCWMSGYQVLHWHNLIRQLLGLKHLSTVMPSRVIAEVLVYQVSTVLQLFLRINSCQLDHLSSIMPGYKISAVHLQDSACRISVPVHNFTDCKPGFPFLSSKQGWHRQNWCPDEILVADSQIWFIMFISQDPSQIRQPWVSMALHCYFKHGLRVYKLAGFKIRARVGNISVDLFICLISSFGDEKPFLMIHMRWCHAE